MTPAQRSLVPTAMIVQLTVNADDPAGVRAGLMAAWRAISQDVQPNTVWGDGYCVGIRTSPPAS